MIAKTKGLLIGALIASLVALLQWKNPPVNYDSKEDYRSRVFGTDHTTYSIMSQGIEFMINLVENTGKQSINPYFPAINIATAGEHNTWLHVVHTDLKELRWQNFVDNAENTDAYPFYTLEQNFSDAPQCGYRLLFKPLTFWKGHAYAVQVNFCTKTIRCVGGIAWGYTLQRFSLRPQAIIPTALTDEEWKQDFKFFKEQFPEFKVSH